MDLRNTGLTEFELLSSLWWVWCNEHLSKGVINHILKGLDIELEFITLNGYKFTSKDKKTTYSYGKQTTKESH